MVKNLCHRQKLWAVQVLVICWTLLAPFGFIGSGAGLSIAFQEAYAQSSIPAGWESYLDRPDILKVPAQAQNLDSSWQKLKDAHFSFIAQLLATYPEGTHFYFLARDSEHLYDVARLVTQGAPEAQRIHLLNISRANMRDSNLKAYLKENGISEETLTQGRRVLFIDTGFAGTIPRVIGENFPVDLRSRLKTQLIVSSNPAHPSSRNFLLHLNPLVNQLHPSQMHGTIVSYEHMPRYMDRSSQLKWIDGRWHPLSPINGASDGSVSKTQSLRYMSDLKAEWEKVDVQQRFQAERSQIQELKKILQSQSDEATLQMKDKIEVLRKLQDPKKYNQLVAQVQDLLESKSQSGLQTSVSLQDLGIAISPSGAKPVTSKKK